MRSAAYLRVILTCLLRSICSGSFKDGPRFKKRLDPERTEFTADAGMLEATKWRLLVVKHAVDRYAPSEELRRYATRAFYVGAAYVSVKAEVRVIGDSDRIFLVVIGDDRQDGAKNLFSCDRHVVLDIDKHRGLYEVTRLKTFWMALTAHEHVRTLLNALADV